MILGTLFFIGFGVNILWNALQFIINWVVIIPLSSIFLGILIGYHTVTLSTVIITKDYLILNYLLIGRKKYIAWKTISDASMRFITTKSSGSDYSFKTGKEIRLFSEGKNYIITTFSIKESEKLLIEINKRLDSHLKTKMKNEYRETKNRFWKEENKYKKVMTKFVIPIFILILISIYAFG
ncbi:hypothetical protein ABW636_16815 [Aquimarina sp. 2201CG1-2-11]|uniref:hypothetical protein n=1 Tax=Aquimarina discodermiae TaxID=3231043 RepID=UPI003461B896